MPANRHVILLGLMSSGKTSVGRRVAKRLGRPLIDGDELLRARTGRTAAEIAGAEGIERLHALEAEIVLDALTATEPAVIGPAASVIEVDAVRRALAGHLVIWLAAPASYLAARAAEKDHRPLLDGGDPLALFEGQLAVREPLAVALAELVVDVTAMSKDAQADAIVALL
ncbi:MAG: shikimate kinase [Acidimicrobiales bacterium]